MNISEQITLSKSSYGPYVKRTLRYEDNEKVDEINLNEDSYKSIFEQIKPNTSFSTPDTMIQGFLQNQKIMPSFYNNRFFTNDEFSNMLEPINDEMKYVIVLNKNNENKRKKFLKNKTRKQKKESVKEKLLKKVYKKRNPKSKNPKTKNPKNKTRQKKKIKKEK